MELKKLQDADVKNKNVLVRVDFNVSCDEKGRVIEDYKIEAAKGTIDYIMQNNPRCVGLLTHFARPDGQWIQEMSTKKIVNDVSKIIGHTIRHVAHYRGNDVQCAVSKTGQKEILLLENVRFDQGEKDNSDALAKDLAKSFDLYVNEAFAVSHRAQASVLGIAQYIPSFAGLWIQKEIESLTKIKSDPEHPAIAIIGGAKIETKVPLIEQFEKTYETILVGGRVAIEVEEQNLKFSNKVIFPDDYAENKFDIGPKTIEKFCNEIAKAKTIVWNGPMGKFEEKPFDRGTRALVDAIAKNAEAFSLIGGGESVQALAESGRWDEISFVSTGGGAMLSFLSGEELPGLSVLQK